MKLVSYPDYKDSDVSWLGKIPIHWDVKPLRAILKQRNEKNDPIKTTQILSLSIAHGVTLYSHEGRGGNKAKNDLTAYKIARVGDIVLNSMNVIVGAVGLSKYTGAISPVYYALYPRTENVDINYYNRVFSNSVFQRYLLIYGKGILIKKSDSGKLNTIRMKISPDDLKNTFLALPTLYEQTQIARFLDWKTSQINKFIHNKQKLIQLLKEQKQNIINQAVTKGIDPNVKLKPSGVEWLGDIPKHWEVRRLKFLVRIKNGSDFKEVEATSGYPVIGSGGQFAFASKFLYEGESVLFGRKGTIDKPLYINGRFWTVDTMFYTEISKNIFAKFLYNCALSFPFNFYSTKTALPSMTQQDLSNHPIALPLFNEQKSVVQFIENETKVINEAISHTTRQIELMREYRNRLISDVVTGKVDVRGISVPDTNNEEMLESDNSVLDINEENVSEVDDIKVADDEDVEL